ncbi:MAG: hypothetical protein RIQ99_478 [Pseudomonadota bacterium]
MNITQTIEIITPAIAHQMLKANTHNRTVSDNRVNQYVSDLVSGRWSVNGEAIKIASDGTLLDGQHRLLAVIKADTPLTTCVVRGLDIDHQNTMDIGRTRSVRDVLHINNVPNASTISSIANNIVRLKKSAEISTFRFNSVSNVEMQEFIEKHPNIVHSAAVAAAKTGNPVPKSVIGTMHYLANYVLNFGEEFDAFNGVLKTGIPTYDGDAAYYLREKVIRQRMSKTVYRPGDLLAMSMNAFEHFVSKKPCTKIYSKDTIAFTGLDPEKI